MFNITEQPRHGDCSTYEKESRQGKKLVVASYNPQARNIVKVSLHLLKTPEAETSTKITEEVFGLSEVAGYNESFERLLAS